ncbi:hypothetical protein S40285_02538 [Stachybotrys chlorohalonatus IBT 40285]|uniref:Uncharacterized protein n=1 Tax=Stachybotrys chlorohalonatus (strain IBT 40285) TaxID=1283841 RepID=A0A084QVX3_STAC4|nr:hypothetical protein S40285_02538 [Stachybotrys chlorohalonata IBT 40285]
MATCTEHPLDVPVDEEPLVGDITVNDLLLYFAIACTVLACLSSFAQILRHATNYTAPKHQKQIIRILFMVPVYSISCTCSIRWYTEHVYIAAGYEFYESLVIAAFYILMCQNIRSEWDEVRKVFNLLTPRKWIMPLRLFHMCFRRSRKGQPSDGLKWFNIVTVAVLQFVVVKFFGALAKCITEAIDVYCAESNSTQHASIWIQIVELVSLAIAMIFLLQFYEQIKVALKEQNPLLKLLAIKLVVFLFYLQSFIFARLTASDGALQPTDRISYPSLAAGLPNAILCFEMLVVSIIHIWAYPTKPYLVKNVNARMKQTSYLLSELGPRTRPGFEHYTENSPVVSQGGRFGVLAFRDALNVTDIVRTIGLAVYWLFVAKRKNDSARYDDEFARRDPANRGEMTRFRTTDLVEAMGRA